MVNRIKDIDPKKASRYINENRGKGTRFVRGKRLDYSTMPKSEKTGMDVFKDYDDDYKTSIKEGRKLWGNNLKRYYQDRFDDYGLDENKIDAYINETNPQNFNDDISQRVNGLMHELYPYAIIGNDNGDNKKIQSGNNIFYALASTRFSDNYNPAYKEDWDYLNEKGFGKYMSDPNKQWTISVDDDNRYYDFYDIDNDGWAKKQPIKLIKDKDGEWHYYDYFLDKDDPSYNRKVIEDGKNIYKGNIKKLTDDNVEYLLRNNSDIGDHTTETIKGRKYWPVRLGSSEGIKFIPYTGPDKVQSNAYGGKINRYYADGGAMGQIPLGEQMPEDYNMVGEGGMHEENPMGGVPYGMNQDGSQNMVEEGEVSVGDNVFSNRIQLSPELCEQLGMPQGTTPAEAMQQIEQLYEQGQISDEEFQEVQQIIFQDQEQQKENVGGSYQQGQVGGPGVQNEGIDPNMGMQMDPMAMQEQPEGITPDMMQGGY